MYLVYLPASVLYATIVGAVAGILVNGVWSALRQRASALAIATRVTAAVVGGLAFGVGFAILWPAVWIGGHPWWAVAAAAVVGAVTAAAIIGKEAQ